MKEEAKNPIDVIGQRVYLEHEDEIEYGAITNAWRDDFCSQIIQASKNTLK